MLAGLGLTRPGRTAHHALAQPGPTPTPALATRAVFMPIYVSPDSFPIDIPVSPEASPAPIGPEATPGPIDPTATPGAEESQCGAFDDSQDVELYNGNLGVPRAFVDELQPPVGNLRWNANLPLLFDDPGTVNGVHWCSGTLIADDLFLTAGHCFSQTPSGWRVPRTNGADSPISRAEIASHMHVSFNYQFDSMGIARAEIPVSVVGLVEDQLGGLDFAIVQLAENPGTPFGRARVAAADAPQGSTVCIIGHPRGLHKKIEAGLASQFQGPNVYYNDIDTDGGSSGAGILSSPAGVIVGIHTNGGCGTVASGNNYGLRISSLLPVSPTLTGIAAT